MVDAKAGVTVKTYEAPRFIGNSEEIGASAATSKSDGTPVEAPPASEADIVQVIVEPTREGLTFAHVRRDAVVGFP